MTKLTITFLTASLLLVGAPLGAAEEHTNETHADCEENQGWIGYTTTRPYTDIVDAVLGQDADVLVCEGEHWDGQDTVRGEEPGRGPTGCQMISPEDGLFVGNCLPTDPNNGAPAIGQGVLGLRVGARQSTTEAYVGADIYGVGKAIVFLDPCAADCGTAGLLAGVYIEDNTDQILSGTNLLAIVVSAAGVTKGYVAEGDCTQGDAETEGTYQYGAETGKRDQCGRDNTAISVQALIP